MDNGKIEYKNERATKEEIFKTPKGGKIERNARGKYKKTVERERLRAKSLGSLEEFVKRKGNDGGRRGDSEEVGLMLILRKMHKTSAENDKHGKKWEERRAESKK